MSRPPSPDRNGHWVVRIRKEPRQIAVAPTNDADADLRILLLSPDIPVSRTSRRVRARLQPRASVRLNEYDAIPSVAVRGVLGLLCINDGSYLSFYQPAKFDRKVL
jgi:hypothetical protein